MYFTRDFGVQAHGAFTIVLSGGSLINGLTPLAGLDTVDFSKWHVFFVDERNVLHTSDDSNFKGAHEAFLSKVRAYGLDNCFVQCSEKRPPKTYKL
jgi:6-phosphogluconolactonase/glucosamine-6-phosphate isomerase/deaminase